MLIAKSKAVHEALQKQFEDRTVRKRYIALVEGLPAPAQGCIRLPLCPDPQDRPRQQVHPQGKPAETHYEVRQTQGDHARVALYPHTGRTHQLRVHAAHPDGLHAPIQGDKLYGARHTEGRLCLHADRLEFRHPVSGEKIVVEIDTPF
jgi:tRNA pseudouridine32 synthase/23S rRNA pseudouridine746 synthase